MKEQNWLIPLYKIYSDEEDLNLITKIVKRGTNWAIGPEIEQFENALKEYLGIDYCVALNSGTSALHAGFLAYGFNQGDEVIVPSFSFISTANAVLFIDGKPVFSDIEEENLGLDPKLIEEKINSNTKAIVPMDYGGLPCKIDEISSIAKNNNLVLIEDAAEALGASIGNRKVGTIADSSIFSFCGNKVLTTGEGGAFVTNSKEIFEKVKSIRSHGRIDTTNYFDNPEESKYARLGYNWRMSSITAGLGISQLSKLDKLISLRRKNASFLSSRLKNIKDMRILNSINDYHHIYQMFSIILKDKETRDNLHNHLTKKKIFSKVYFNPIHLNPFYKKRFKTKEKMLPKTEEIASKILTLPLYPNMTNEEMEYVINSTQEFFENNSK